MSGWDARQWANIIITGVVVLFGLAVLLRRPKAGKSWWSWDRLFGAAIIIFALVTLTISPGPTSGGLISNGIMFIAFALWFLLGDVWRVNGPDIPTGTLLRQRFKGAVCLTLSGGAFLALGLTIPR